MATKKVAVLWSDNAKADLKRIYEFIKITSQSVQVAKNVRDDILGGSRKITYAEQYQVDEILGLSFRRMIVRHYKIIYKTQSDAEIRVLSVFDTRQDPKKLRETNSLAG
jgi:plasmid stabilization system protein ParE